MITKRQMDEIIVVLRRIYSETKDEALLQVAVFVTENLKTEQ